MQWVEIPKRSVFRHPVKVDRVGVTLVWNFSTMKRVRTQGLWSMCAPGVRSECALGREERLKATRSYPRLSARCCQDIAFGVSVRNVPETDAKGLKEILPIRRYDSHKVSVKVRQEHSQLMRRGGPRPRWPLPSETPLAAPKQDPARRSQAGPRSPLSSKTALTALTNAR